MKKTTSPLDAEALLEMYFLDARSALLEATALLDRVQACEGGEALLETDPRIASLRAGCRILLDDAPDRTRRFLEVLSVD